MDRPCRIELLGALRVYQGERVMTRFHTYKTGALLAWLAYTRRPQVRETVIEMLWPEGSLDRGRNNLSVALSSLRNQLEPPGVPTGAVLIADRTVVGLNPDAVVTDTAEFEALLRAADSTRNDAERAHSLLQAADLYGGELLPGYHQDWIPLERQRLAELYLQTLRRLVRHFARCRDLAAALDIARRAVTAAPLHEEAHQDLIRLLNAMGQPEAALRQYRDLERTLAEAQEVAPSPASRQILEAIESALQAPHQPPGPTPARSPSAVGAPAVPITPPTGTVTFLLLNERGPDTRPRGGAIPGAGRTSGQQAPTGEWRVGDGKRRAGDDEARRRQEREECVAPIVRRHDGHLRVLSDGTLQAAFARPADALRCAIACREAIDRVERGRPSERPQTRMALHAGEADLQEDDYRGSGPEHTARLLAATHGGQILCSEAVATLLGGSSGATAPLTDLGVYRLRGHRVAERLFQIDLPGHLQPPFPAPDAETLYSDTLPLQFTRFFGREQELARLESLLLAPLATDAGAGGRDGARGGRSETRLVTLTGPGGTGKTRLALEAARRMLAPLSGAVWFVPLADLQAAHAIRGAIADAMRLPRSQEGDPLEQAIAILIRQPAVLILDNFEHLVEAGTPIVQTLLERVPTLRCLITSRQAVNIAGERLFPLEPLETPGDGDSPERLCLYDSVQLFIDRAQAVRPDFQVTGNNAAALATLCDRLDGLPLAIELAAARSAVLTPSQMLAQLQNRFDFLVSRKRDASERHRTLRATMDWSFQLLSSELQRFFTHLAVFRGGCTEAEAEAVCEEPLALDRLAQLRECSLIAVREQGSTMRFRMLETVRQYGLEKLDAGAAQRLRLRHAEVYLQVVRQLDARLREGDAGAVAAGQAEMDNVREAVQWACQEPTLATAPTLAAEFARSVGRLWVQLGHWNEFLARAPVLRHSLQRLNDRPGEARLLDLCANILHRQGKHEAARDHAASALTLWRVCGHDRMAALLSNLAWYAFHAGDVEEARRLAAESLALARAEDDREAIGFTLAVQADLALAVGDADAARALTAEAGEHFTAVGDRAGAAIALERMGAAEQLAGVPDRARQRYLEALDLLRGLGYRFGVASVLFRLSALYGAREEAEDVEVEGVKQGPQSATREEPEPAQSEIAVALMALVARIDRELGAPHRHFALQDSAPTVYTESRYAVHSAPVSSYEEELDRLLPILRQPLSSRLDP